MTMLSRPFSEIVGRVRGDWTGVNRTGEGDADIERPGARVILLLMGDSTEVLPPRAKIEDFLGEREEVWWCFTMARGPIFCKSASRLCSYFSSFSRREILLCVRRGGVGKESQEGVERREEGCDFFSFRSSS
jgi:hypothetical protein